MSHDDAGDRAISDLSGVLHFEISQIPWDSLVIEARLLRKIRNDHEGRGHLTVRDVQRLRAMESRIKLGPQPGEPGYDANDPANVLLREDAA